ncbi:senescence-associated protein [Penicillium longicatenatum]|nr:senescence-associated protein [Penicillium longicatenatum]
MVCIHTENQNQGDFYPFVLLEISMCRPSQTPHSDNVFNPDRPAKDLNARRWAVKPSSASLNK